jgi:hypothetical protein
LSHRRSALSITTAVLFTAFSLEAGAIPELEIGAVLSSTVVVDPFAPPSVSTRATPPLALPKETESARSSTATASGATPEQFARVPPPVRPGRRPAQIVSTAAREVPTRPLANVIGVGPGALVSSGAALILAGVGYERVLGEKFTIGARGIVTVNPVGPGLGVGAHFWPIQVAPGGWYLAVNGNLFFPEVLLVGLDVITGYRMFFMHPLFVDLNVGAGWVFFPEFGEGVSGPLASFAFGAAF